MEDLILQLKKLEEKDFQISKLKKQLKILHNSFLICFLISGISSATLTFFLVETDSKALWAFIALVYGSLIGIYLGELVEKFLIGYYKLNPKTWLEILDHENAKKAIHLKISNLKNGYEFRSNLASESFPQIDFKEQDSDREEITSLNGVDSEEKKLHSLSTTEVGEPLWRGINKAKTKALSIIKKSIFKKLESNFQNEVYDKPSGEKGNDQTKISNEVENIIIGEKIDFEQLNKNRTEIGAIGELIVLNYEVKRLARLGLNDLIRNVIHVSKESDSFGYDILSYCDNRERKYIEVKSTTQGSQAPFYLTETEIRMMNTLKNYFIYRVYNLNLETQKAEIYFINCETQLKPFYKFEPTLFRVTPINNLGAVDTAPLD
ncbi:DUF3883 domain-containing protein [Pollutibacter soli]|uniref:DUF3883 domain-containing protein n=1 Tax=Pollutibacter soli TaxID=3034157 RepID=UPI003013D02D